MTKKENILAKPIVSPMIIQHAVTGTKTSRGAVIRLVKNMVVIIVIMIVIVTGQHLTNQVITVSYTHLC